LIEAPRRDGGREGQKRQEGKKGGTKERENFPDLDSNFRGAGLKIPWQKQGGTTVKQKIPGGERKSREENESGRNGTNLIQTPRGKKEAGI